MPELMCKGCNMEDGVLGRAIEAAGLVWRVQEGPR